MKRVVALLVCLLLQAGLAMADDLKEAADRVPVLTDRIAALGAGKTGEYGREQLAAAQATLGAVKAAIAAKNGTQALQKAELVELQLTIAEARAAEQEGAEQLVLRRAELKKLEGQFDQLLQPAAGGK